MILITSVFLFFFSFFFANLSLSFSSSFFMLFLPFLFSSHLLTIVAFITASPPLLNPTQLDSCCLVFSPPPMHSLCSMSFHTAAIMKYGVSAWSNLATVWIKIHTTYRIYQYTAYFTVFALSSSPCLYDLRVIKKMFCSVVVSRLFFQNLLHEHHSSANKFGSRSGLTFCWCCLQTISAYEECCR